jgi:NAD(P)-dependent dehydrogenase (short-subunit alcohol dehydrogenase family)
MGMTERGQKVWFITGAGRGMGIDMARAALDAGHAVVGTARNAARVTEAVGEHENLLALSLDITDASAAEAAADAAVKRFGRIDVLVNNAGIWSSLVATPFEQLSVDEWRRVFDVNVMGMFLATRAVAPHMREAKRGRVINIASGTPYKGVPFFMHYVASKGAVIAMSRVMAKELGKDNILVNTIAPGFTLSDGVMDNPIQVEQLQDISNQARVLVRDQYPEDIVGAVLFFASDRASFITGQSLVVDGGAYFN